MARSAATSSEEQPDQEPTAEESAREEFQPYVEWTGGPGYREVTRDQWNSVGIDQNTVVWTRESPRVLLSDLSKDAAERLSAEPGFSFVLEPPKED